MSRLFLSRNNEGGNGAPGAATPPTAGPPHSRRLGNGGAAEEGRGYGGVGGVDVMATQSGAGEPSTQGGGGGGSSSDAAESFAW
jgi:hypothetical protein